MKAFSHQQYPITYELTTESGWQSNEFAITQSGGVVDLLRKLDYEKDMQQYHLKIKAVENGRPTRTSSVIVSTYVRVKVITRLKVILTVIATSGFVAQL